MMELAGDAIIEFGEIEIRRETLYARIRVDWRLVPRALLEPNKEWVIGKVSENMLDLPGRTRLRAEWLERGKRSLS